jgi:hypothetical protein
VRQGRAVINARLEALEGGTARLSEQLLGEREVRTAEGAAAQVEAQRSAASTLHRLEQVAQELASRLDESQARLHDEVRQLQQANEVLAARVAELERPRSLRWYYCLDGKTAQGPVTAAELKELIRSRRLVPTSKVSLDGKKWHPASHLKGVRWV